MVDLFDADETVDETGTNGPENIHDDVGDDTQPLTLDDIDTWELEEPDVGLTGLA